MRVAGNKQTRANLPLGKHNAKVIRADDKGLEFELLDGDQRGIRLIYAPPRVISPKSDFGKAVGFLRGYGLSPDEDLDLSVLVGKQCAVHVGSEQGDKMIKGVSAQLHGKKV